MTNPTDRLPSFYDLLNIDWEVWKQIHEANIKQYAADRGIWAIHLSDNERERARAVTCNEYFALVNMGFWWDGDIDEG